MYNNIYSQYPSYQGYNQQQFTQYQPRQQENVFEVRYGTFDEAKAYIVAPTKSAMFIDRNNSMAYLKSTDFYGNPNLESFKFSKVEPNVKPVESEEQYLTRKDAEFFVTKEDLKNINDKFISLEKLVKGDGNNGEQQTDTISQ